MRALAPFAVHTDSAEPSAAEMEGNVAGGFTVCEGDEHLGRGVWKPYPYGFRGKDRDGNEYGQVWCKLCGRVILFGITQADAIRHERAAR